MWQKQWAKAEADLREITKLGYDLYPDYKAMFKAANEKNDEYIFQYQYTDDAGLGNCFAQCYGSRVSVDNAWNNFIPNPKFVDSYEWADGKPFNVEDKLPGYNSMKPQARSVFYLRDGLTPDGEMKNQYKQMKDYGAIWIFISRTAMRHASARFTTDVTRVWR